MLVLTAGPGLVPHVLLVAGGGCGQVPGGAGHQDAAAHHQDPQQPRRGLGPGPTQPRPPAGRPPVPRLGHQHGRAGWCLEHGLLYCFDKSHIIIIVTHLRCDFDLAENLLTIKSLPYH